MIPAQLFTGTHAQALARADALEAGLEPASAPTAQLPSLTPLDMETLGEIAARVVHFGSGDLEPAEIDLDHDHLFAMPRFWCEVLAELGVAEDPDAVDEVAQAWAADDDMPSAGNLDPLIRAVVTLVTAAQTAGTEVYLWVATD